MFRTIVVKTRTDLNVDFYPLIETYSEEDQKIITAYENLEKRMEKEKKVLARFVKYENNGFKRIKITYYADEAAYLERMNSPEMIALNNILVPYETANLEIKIIKEQVDY